MAGGPPPRCRGEVPGPSPRCPPPQVVLVERAGRRVLELVGLLGMMGCALTLTLALNLQVRGNPPNPPTPKSPSLPPMSPPLT